MKKKPLSLSRPNSAGQKTPCEEMAMELKRKQDAVTDREIELRLHAQSKSCDLKPKQVSWKLNTVSIKIISIQWYYFDIPTVWTAALSTVIQIILGWPGWKKAVSQGEETRTIWIWATTVWGSDCRRETGWGREAPLSARTGDSAEKRTYWTSGKIKVR